MTEETLEAVPAVRPPAQAQTEPAAVAGDAARPADAEKAEGERPQKFTMTVQGGMLEALGINMYTSIGKCLLEFVANAYDSDATYCEISLPFDEIDAARAEIRKKAKAEVAQRKRAAFTVLLDPLAEDIKIVVRDDGHGMSGDEVQNKFLPLNRHRRGTKNDQLKPSELLEYKRAAFRLLRHRAFASPAAEAVMQTAEYVEHVSARRETLERRLGARLGTLRRTVVAGRAADADPMRLSRAREAARGVRVLGWDEVATSARRRYRVPDGWEPDSAA